MELFRPFYLFLSHLDSKRFYQYLIGFLGIVIVISGIFIFYNYRASNKKIKEIKRINTNRENAQEILERAESVAKQRKEVDALLEEDADFKIGGYFKEILIKQGLTQKEKMETTQTVEREDNYIEQSLNAKFVDMNMKDLTLLLEEIESNKRIYTRELEIKRSEKTPGTIDVTLVIATLLPTAIVS